MNKLYIKAHWTKYNEFCGVHNDNNKYEFCDVHQWVGTVSVIAILNSVLILI